MSVTRAGQASPLPSVGIDDSKPEALLGRGFHPATRNGIQRVCKHQDLVLGFLAHTGLTLDP